MGRDDARLPRGIGIMPRMDRAQSLEARTGLLPLARPLMTGEVLDAAFRLFRAGLLRCLPYSGLAVLVLQLPTLYSTLLGRDAPLGRFTLPVPAQRGIVGLFEVTDRHLILVAALLLGVVLFGVITLRLYAVSRGERPRFRTEIAAAIYRWPTAIIATCGALGLPALLYTYGMAFGGMLPFEAVAVLAVPLLWPMALLAVSLPAFWCDRLGPFAAIARGARVSLRGSWRMVGAFLATLCIVTVFYVLSAIIAAMFAQVLGRADLFLIATMRSMLSLVVGAFGVPFVLAMLIVAYEDLKLRDRERREARS